VDVRSAVGAAFISPGREAREWMPIRKQSAESAALSAQRQKTQAWDAAKLRENNCRLTDGSREENGVTLTAACDDFERCRTEKSYCDEIVLHCGQRPPWSMPLFDIPF